MSDPTMPHDCSGDAAAYVLGALEPAEAEAFRRHLESCVVCRDEVTAFERLVDVLPSAVPQYRAPRSLRRDVRRDVRSAPKPEAPRRRQWPAAVSPWGATAGALAALAVVLVLVLSGGGSGSRVVAASVVGSGRADVSLTGTQAELVLRDFPAPPAGEVYQVWLQRGQGRPIPTGTLFRSPHGARQRRGRSAACWGDADDGHRRAGRRDGGSHHRAGHRGPSDLKIA